MVVVDDGPVNDLSGHLMWLTMPLCSTIIAWPIISIDILPIV
jgi:hypothetical protein